MDPWWKTFFDGDYLRLWSAPERSPDTAQQVAGLWDLLSLREGSRVLDAPCGYGRLSLPLARREAIVVGVDQSAELLAQAEKDRGDLPANRLKYLRHDLREPLPESGRAGSRFVRAAACWLTLRTETWRLRAFPAEQNRRNGLRTER